MAKCYPIGPRRGSLRAVFRCDGVTVLRSFGEWLVVSCQWSVVSVGGGIPSTPSRRNTLTPISLNAFPPQKSSTLV